MNRFLTIGLGAAAVVVLLFFGSRLLGSPTNVGGPGVEPTPTPKASAAEPSAEPSVEPSPTPVGLLSEGPHVLGVTPTITVTIPAPDWYGEPARKILVKNYFADAPDGAGIIGPYAGDLYVPEDPCQWSTTMPDAPITTVDELVAALGSQESREASAPVDVTVDGYAGKSITLHVPDDAVFGDCDQNQFCTLTENTVAICHRYNQDPGQIDELWILDVDGVPMVIDAGYYEGTPAEHVEEMRAIIESATFGE